MSFGTYCNWKVVDSTLEYALTSATTTRHSHSIVLKHLKPLFYRAYCRFLLIRPAPRPVI